VPGQYAGPGEDNYSTGEAYISTTAAFVIFLISDSIALFVSLAVVMVQTSLVVIDPKALKIMVFIVNKLMWACCISISVSFVSLSYVVIGQEHWWLSWSTVVVAALILVGTLGIMMYCVVKYRVQRKRIKRSIKKAVSGVGESFARCRSLVAETLLKVECKKKVYAI
ncbi:ankyrin repeat-containing protein At5g02620-like, partial [Asparagus officinalis]